MKRNILQVIEWKAVLFEHIHWKIICLIDDMCTVNEAEVDNQQSRVASDAETQTEGTIDYGPGISEVAAPQLSQPVELQTLEPLNYDQNDANNTGNIKSNFFLIVYH